MLSARLCRVAIASELCLIVADRSHKAPNTPKARWTPTQNPSRSASVNGAKSLYHARLSSRRRRSPRSIMSEKDLLKQLKIKTGACTR